jgi:hypothetical protein
MATSAQNWLNREAANNADNVTGDTPEKSPNKVEETTEYKD